MSDRSQIPDAAKHPVQIKKGAHQVNPKDKPVGKPPVGPPAGYAATSLRVTCWACGRCTQGVMDSTNPHLLGTCGCECHKRGEHAAVGAHETHKQELLAQHPDWTTEQWVAAALEAAERDFALANRWIEEKGLHPLTWTPPLVEIAREKFEADHGE